ncbi:MAG: hypothetical protein VB042_04355 [Victivallaceae bacterium]|nr:hypothetical protein [Victivallaceae bacterium]
MKSKALSFLGRNKSSFIIGIFCYFFMVAVLWFFDFTGHESCASSVLCRVLCVPASTLDVLGFPYTLRSYQDTFLALISYPIGILWCGLCVVVVRKILALLKPLFPEDYILFHVKNEAYLSMFILKGIAIGVLGSLISMLFNPVFLIVMEILALIYDYSDLVAAFERNNYILLIFLYALSSLLSGVVYGLLMFYLSTYKIIRVFAEDRL